MKEQNKGHIINIGSLASLCPYKGIILTFHERTNNKEGCSLYGVSKTAVRFFSLAADEVLTISIFQQNIRNLDPNITLLFLLFVLMQ